MVIQCQDIWREISNYLEGEIDPVFRAALEKHIEYCRPCTAVLDGTHNIIVLLGDDRAFELPAGFTERLFNRVNEEILRS